MTDELDTPPPSPRPTPADVVGPSVDLGAGAGEPPIDAAPSIDEIPENELDDEPSRGARALVDWIVVVAIALTVAFLVRGFVLAHFVVDGSSMDSTLASGDRVFVNKLSYRLHDPNRGDVVVLHQISGASQRDLIKRVIALPGETIEMTNCEVRILEVGASQSRVLSEPYLDENIISASCGGDFGPVSVPEDHVFVMGDNRSGSQDSRQLGPVSYDDLVGRAFVVFWPRSSWRWL